VQAGLREPFRPAGAERAQTMRTRVGDAEIASSL
jgi:hypothetical protein